MSYQVDFGFLGATSRTVPGPVFRVAVLADFSGRASTGVAETGTRLAARKPLPVDVDSIDDVLARLAPRIAIPLGDEGTVEIDIAAMDDFHPDQLVEALPLFEELLALRRNLMSRAGFDRAAKTVLSWAGAEPLPPPETRRARGGSIATDRRLSDFSRLTGRPAATEASVDELVRRLVGPFVTAGTDSRQEALVARVDEALSAALRRILHHPEFQSTEALWRSVDMLVRSLETGARLQLVLYDITAEEWAADLAGATDLRDTALYSLLIEQPSLDDGAGPISLIAGLYGFELSPPHADLLGRMAQLAAAAGAPFVAAIGPDALRTPEHEWHPMMRQAWAALRALPASVYLGLVAPRTLLRMPYGKRTDPIDAFAFEEFTRQGGLSSMLWGNPAALVARLAAEAWSAGGKSMRLGSVNVVGEMPVYVYRDADGDQVALPCTERLFTERVAAQVASVGVIPVVSLRGRPEVRVAGFASVAGVPLAGRWAPVAVEFAPPPPPPPPAPTPVADVMAPLPAAEAPAQAAAVPVPVAEPTPDEAAGTEDLDALLAGLAVADPVEPAVSAKPPDAAPPEDDLDALLASLSAEAPPAGADGTEADLDALLASLK